MLIADEGNDRDESRGMRMRRPSSLNFDPIESRQLNAKKKPRGFRATPAATGTPARIDHHDRVQNVTRARRLATQSEPAFGLSAG